MSRILIGALSGWQHVDRRDRCVNTWFRDAHNCGLDSVLLLGLPGIPRPERRGDLLLLPSPDSYESLPQRTRWFCEWALGRDDWEYLFKCDDDTYVAAARLAALATEGRDYIGAEWKPGVAYGSGGGGYLLSRRAAKIVAEHMRQETGAEDQLVGKVLREHGIPLHIDNRFVPFGNREKRPRSDNDTITVHGVEADLFFAAHHDSQPPFSVSSSSDSVIDLASRETLMRSLPHGGIVAEVGVQRGEFASTILHNNHPSQLFLIDCWEKQNRPLYENDRTTREDHESDYRHVVEKFHHIRHVSIVRNYSVAAASQFPSNFFDIVYIDADHMRLGADIVAYWPLVKSGGWLCGHDYFTSEPWVTCEQAVNNWAAMLGLQVSVTKDLPYPSWAIQKP